MATNHLIYMGNKENLPASRNAKSVYFVTDTREIYFGADLYTEAVRFYTGEKPAAPAQGVLYVNEVTGAGDVWNGTAWKPVFKAYATAIDNTAIDDTVPTSKAVKDYVDGEIGKIPAQTDYTVTVEESSPEGYAKAYTIKQKGTEVATINIPKDMVVESGSVVTNPEGQPKGTYLKLVLANATEDEIFINVGDLIEYVTSGSADGDMVVINIDANHKVTATITDGTITLAKLHADLQAEIAKAHEHTNKAELDKITDGDKAKWDAATDKAHEHENKTVLDGVTGEKVEAWDAAVVAITVGTF